MAGSFGSAFSLLQVVRSAIYGTNFSPKIFTDITIPDTKFYSPHIGKITQHLI
jgi:hypothetical protein